MEKIRVLQVLDEFNVGFGACSVVMNYYNNINNDDIVFDFMVHAEVPEYYENLITSRNSRIYVMPELKAKNLYKYIKVLNNFFAEHNEYQIVHGHIPNAALFYLGAAKKHNVKARIIHSHNSKGSDNYIKRIRNFFLNISVKYLANYYVACSDKAAIYLYGKNFINKEKILILKNAINVEKYSFNPSVRNNLRKKMNLEDKYVIGHVGRFNKQKNHTFLLEIFKCIHDADKNTVLLLIGNGEKIEEIMNKVHKLNLDESVIFLGIRKDVNELMQVMDVFVLPSLFEGLPVVGVEAQASGLPCVFSAEITRQTDITGNVTFLNLDCDVNVWRDTILSYKNIDRLFNKSQIKSQGFDIKDQAEILNNFYLNCLSNN